MIAAILVTVALSYLLGGINGAILLSRLFYGEDIREKGSKNPGFTNFRRVYGNNFVSWSVMIFDLSKTVLPVLTAAIVFHSLYGQWELGAAVSGLCCTIGHCFPVWYRFKGGKGFLSSLAALWVIDWRAGLAATCVMIFFLLVFKYMSLATMTALSAGTVLLAVLHIAVHPIAVVLYACSVALMIFRHKENIIRLQKGTESKFTFKKKSQNAVPEVH